MNALKVNLRQHYLSEREALSHTIKKDFDQAIVLKLLDLFVREKPHVIHTYLPMGSEIDFYEFIQYALDQGVQVVCPITMQRPLLRHRALKSFDELASGRYGTKHPKGEVDYFSNYDWIIVPGLAYSSSNHRLGYGGGYYDHFLQFHKSAHTIGLFYTFQHTDQLPIENHDIPLHTIITN